MQNFNYMKDPKFLKVPIPIEFLQSLSREVLPSNETIRNFLKIYYDNRIEEFKPNQITYIPVKIDLGGFYLNPAYFG